METLMLLYGGNSTEHEVSCLSAENIYSLLAGIGYDLIPVGISRSGAFYLQEHGMMASGGVTVVEDPDRELLIWPGTGFLLQGTVLNPDVILPVTHGTFGEDGILQGMLSMLPFPYIGSDHAASAAGMRKSITKRLLSPDIPITPYRLCDAADLPDPSEVIREFGLPLVVKPDCGGSSVGVSIIHDAPSLIPAVRTALQYDDAVLIEPCINAIEIECGVFGTRHDVSATLPGTVSPSHGFYSYEEKYHDPLLAYTIPAPLEQAMLSRIQEYARSAFSLLGCSGFARVDFFLDRDNGELYLNEINAIPGLTPTSLFLKLVEASGITIPALFSRLVDDAVTSYRKRRSLVRDIPSP